MAHKSFFPPVQGLLNMIWTIKNASQSIFKNRQQVTGILLETRVKYGPHDCRNDHTRRPTYFKQHDLGRWGDINPRRASSEAQCALVRRLKHNKQSE
jgi:hypothetical protein